VIFTLIFDDGLCSVYFIFILLVFVTCASSVLHAVCISLDSTHVWAYVHNGRRLLTGVTECKRS